MMHRRLFVFACALSLYACGASETGSGEDDAEGRGRDAGRGDIAFDAGGERDVPVDTNDDDATDAPSDTADGSGESDGGVLPDTDGGGVPTTCGDGTLDEGEGCDDGNNDDGDGCDAACVRELDFLCSPCTRNETCGSDEDLCVDGGCGADCTVWPCQVGQTCAEVLLGTESRRQCIPDEGCGLSSDEEVCDNMIDDDGDRFVDCADPDCAGFPGCDGDEICDNGIDDDGDNLTDCEDVDCFFDAVCGSAEDCGNGVDDDADTLIDCEDSDCAADPRCGGIDISCSTALSARLGSQGGTLIGTSGHTGTCGGSGPEAVWSFTATSGGSHCIQVDGEPGLDALLYARETCESPSTEISCDDDGGDGLDPVMEPILSAGDTISIFVDSVGAGSSGTYTLEISEGLCGEGGGGTCVPDNTILGEGTVTGSVSGTSDAAPCSTTDLNGPEHIILWTPSTTGTYCIDTNGSSFDTILSARTECGAGTCIDYDDDGGADSGTSELELLVSAFDVIYLQVDGFSSSEAGAYTLTVREGSCDGSGGGGPDPSFDCFTDADDLGLAGSGSATGTCPADCSGAFVYGTDIYTGDSWVCGAAIHAGVITSDGGAIRVVGLPGQDDYEGSTRNGVTSSSWSLGDESSFRVESP